MVLATLWPLTGVRLVPGDRAAFLWRDEALQPAAANPENSSQRSRVSTHLRRAEQALEAHDLAAAKAELALALQADPKSADAYVMLGTVAIAGGDTAGAIRQYQHALKLNPNSFSAHYNLGMAYLRGHDLAAGRLQLERAVAIDPRHADAAYNLGLVLLELRKPGEAAIHLRRAKSLGPDRPDVAFNLVKAELAEGQPDRARQDAQDEAKALAHDAPWNASVGRLFLENKLPPDAVPYLETAFRLHPSNADLRRDLGLAYDESGQPEPALSLIQQPTTAQDHYLRASAYLLMRRFPEAQLEVARSLEETPREPQYLLLSARLHQHLGQHTLALHELEAITRLAPDWSEPYYSLAVSYYFERRYVEARRSLDEALKLDPKSARSLFLYAASLVNEGKNRDAENYLHRAIALEPENARFEYHLGAVLLRDNRPAEAEQAFDKAVQLKPEFALPHYQLGKILARQGQLAAAERELEKAVQEEPGLAQAYYQLSTVYAALGESEKSAHALDAFSKLKKQEVNEDQEIFEDMNKELSGP